MIHSNLFGFPRIQLRKVAESLTTSYRYRYHGLNIIIIIVLLLLPLLLLQHRPPKCTEIKIQQTDINMPLAQL